MSHKYQFRAVIESVGNGGAFVTVPFDVEEAIGKQRVIINPMVDGEPYTGSLMRMDSPGRSLPALKEIRQKRILQAIQLLKEGRNGR